MNKVGIRIKPDYYEHRKWFCELVISYLKENPPTDELPEDAADRPDVDGVGVVAGAQQYLRRPVVLGYHLLRHRPAWVSFLNPAQRK